MSQAFHRYMKLQKQFTHEVSSMALIKTVIMSLIQSTLILLIPVLIGINLIIFIDLRYYLLIYFTLLGLLFIEFYYLSFKRTIIRLAIGIEKLNLDFMFFVERRLIQLIFFIIFGLIILQLGV
jgi:hypothetical protein